MQRAPRARALARRGRKGHLRSVVLDRPGGQQGKKGKESPCTKCAGVRVEKRRRHCKEGKKAKGQPKRAALCVPILSFFFLKKLHRDFRVYSFRFRASCKRKRKGNQTVPSGDVGRSAQRPQGAPRTTKKEKDHVDAAVRLHKKKARAHTDRHL